MHTKQNPKQKEERNPWTVLVISFKPILPLKRRHKKRKKMKFIVEILNSIRSLNVRQLLSQAITIGLIMSTALMIWKGLICVSGSESPAVVVLSESMEPGFQRGDMLFLRMTEEPIRAGEIVVYNVDGRSIPIVHRVIKVHEHRDTGEVDVLTKRR
ncbi:hypothetical protein QJS10_CPB11g00495 [Acorus calamus]|uniref:signal peptidase I n=1 Tax=Acorus calamus TaxID=4465 RepID=A0AAV9DVZ6_ACOCL|nr:hypothetical protein QJS10_CPB11g00495 [Acorus calamus]